MLCRDCRRASISSGSCPDEAKPDRDAQFVAKHAELTAAVISLTGLAPVVVDLKIKAKLAAAQTQVDQWLGIVPFVQGVGSPQEGRAQKGVRGSLPFACVKPATCSLTPGRGRAQRTGPGSVGARAAARSGPQSRNAAISSAVSSGSPRRVRMSSGRFFGSPPSRSAPQACICSRRARSRNVSASRGP